MKFFERLGNRPPGGDTTDVSTASDSSHEEGELPISHYDKLDLKQLRTELSTLSQVDLAAVKEYETAHEARPVVLNRLHWLQEGEPVSGYDALDEKAIIESLSDADAETLKGVREYERRHQARFEVLMEVERALPTAGASAGQKSLDKERDARVNEGFADRAKTAPPPPSR